MTKEKEIERIFERYGFRSLFPEDRPEALGHPDFEPYEVYIQKADEEVWIYFNHDPEDVTSLMCFGFTEILKEIRGIKTVKELKDFIGARCAINAALQENNENT